MEATTKIKIGNRTLTVYGSKPGMILPNIDDDFLLDNADATASNQVDDFAIYCLPDGIHQLEIYLEQGYPSNAAINIIRPIREVILDCDYGDMDHHEWLSAWGQDPELTVADEDSTASKFRIWITPNYYQGNNNEPQPGWLRDEETNEPMEFGTYADAQATVDKYYNEPSAYDGIPQCNVLSHGQAGADDLTIAVWEYF